MCIRRCGDAGVLLPEKLLRFSVGEGGQVLPHFLGEHDHPWLSALLEEYRTFEGRPRRLLEERLVDPPPGLGPAGKRRMAILVLDRLCRDRSHSAVVPAEARALVFAEAA